jgi:hypothetical protein
MPMKTLAAFAGIAVLLAAGPAAAQVPAPSVAVDGCGFNTWTLIPNSNAGAVQIRFVANVPTDVVDFRLSWGDGKLTALHDVGHFTPGVEIAHQLDFQLPGPVSGETVQSLRVQVTRTHAESGATWEAPASGGPDFACKIYPGWL